MHKYLLNLFQQIRLQFKIANPTQDHHIPKWILQKNSKVLCNNVIKILQFPSILMFLTQPKYGIQLFLYHVSQSIPVLLTSTFSFSQLSYSSLDFTFGFVNALHAVFENIDTHFNCTFQNSIGLVLIATIIPRQARLFPSCLTCFPYIFMFPNSWDKSICGQHLATRATIIYFIVIMYTNLLLNIPF